MFPKVKNNFSRSETSLQFHVSLTLTWPWYSWNTNSHSYLLIHDSVFLLVLFSRKKCPFFVFLFPFPTPFLAWLTSTSSSRCSSTITFFKGLLLSLSLVLRPAFHYGPLTSWTYLITYHILLKLSLWFLSAKLAAIFQILDFYHT